MFAILFFMMGQTLVDQFPHAEGNRTLEDEKSARTDRYGDPLPPRAIARAGTFRLRHREGVSALAFSSDGKRLYSAEELLSGVQVTRSSIHVWEVASGKLLGEFGGQVGGASSIALSPNGKALVSLGGDASIWLWEAGSGQLIRQFEENKNGHRCPISFSPDGKTLASIGKTIDIWDVATGEHTRALPDCGRSVLFSSDAKSLLSIRSDRIALREADSGKEIRSIMANGDDLECLALAPGGKILAAGGKMGIVHLWDLSAANGLFDLKGHKGTVRVLAFSRDGAILASGADKILLWNLATGRIIRQLTGHNNSLESLAFSPDNKILASGGADNTIRLWDVVSGKELLPFEGPRDLVPSIAFCPDGKTIASANWDRTVRIFDANTGKQVGVLRGHSDEVLVVAFTPDGRGLVSGSWDGEIRLWDWAKGKHLCSFKGHQHYINSVDISQDGRLLASASQDYTIRFWDLATGKQLRQTQKARVWEEPESIAFSPNGKILFAGNRDKIIHLWEVATAKEIRTFRGHTDEIKAIAISSDGRTLASASFNDESSIRLWNIAAGRELRQFTCRGVNTLAFSPNGRLLVSGGTDGIVSLWEAASGREICKFAGHDQEVTSVAFTPNGRTVASSSRDSTIVTWDVTGRVNNGHLKMGALVVKDLPILWEKLAGDSPEAFQAVWALATSAAESVPFLKERLRPFPLISKERLGLLLVDLDSEEFNVRQKASDELESLGPIAESDLRKLKEGNPSKEARKRVDLLLGRIENSIPSPNRLREMRALQVLEEIGTQQAEEILKSLAQGEPKAELTQDAKGCLARLAKQASGRIP